MRALVAIAIIVAMGIVLIATGVFDPAMRPPPSQFDHDNGAVPPTADERALASVQAGALIATLPVSVVALCIAASALRSWKEQVTAIVATSLSALSALAGIVLAWIGVGTVVFFT